MPVTAKIQFKQGATTTTAGWAMLGSIGSAVTVMNQNNSEVVNSTFELLDVPAASALARGIIQDGALVSVQFTPDVRGCYLVRLTTKDLAGNQAIDVRTFGVLETTGRLIPPFLGQADAMNFSGQTRGWAKYLEQYLHAVDTGGGGGDNIVIVFDNYTAVSRDIVMVHSACSCPFSIFMPNPTPHGSWVEVQAIDTAGGAPTLFEVNGNGADIKDPTSNIFVPSVNFNVPGGIIRWMLSENDEWLIESGWWA